MEYNFHPYIVTAPLKLDSAPNLDTDTIFVFDYKNSFKTSVDKPRDMIKYLETFGGMFDLMIDKNVLYKEKEELLTYYFNSGSFFNCYSLTRTLIHILFRKKEIDCKVGNSIFNDREADKFIDRNKTFVNDLVTFFNSLFLIMLVYASNPTKDIKNIKNKYPKERYKKDEFSPNICNVLFESLFYEYYSKSVNNDIYYYTFMLDYTLYRGKDFLSVLINENNTLIPVMLDMNNPIFQKFLEEIKV